MDKVIMMNITLKKPVKVHVVSESFLKYHNNSGLVKWINEGNVETCDFDDSELILLRGGQDINPARYGEKHSSYTWSTSDERDNLEFEAYQKAIDSKKIVVGICRGCQLITIANGGKLIQHVPHHYQNHPVLGTLDNKMYETNSVHHQMCFPYYLPREKYKILAYSTKEMFNTNAIRKVEYHDQNGNQYIPNGSSTPLNRCSFAEPEMIWYPQTLSLGVQGHPETLSYENGYLKYINNFLLREIIKRRT